MCSLPPPLEGHSCLCPLTSSTLTSLGGDPQRHQVPSAWLHQVQAPTHLCLPWASQLRLEGQLAMQGAWGRDRPTARETLRKLCLGLLTVALPGCGSGPLPCKSLPRTLGLALGSD